MTYARILAVMLLVAIPVAGWSQVRMDSKAVPVAPLTKGVPGDQIAMKSDIADRMTVNVHIGGKGPFRFLVDTGSERTVISRELANKLSLQAGEPVRLHSVVGVKGVETVMIPSLRVARNDISVLDAPALSAGNIGADGMLGIDSLRSKRVMMDFKAGTMSIVPTDEPTARMEGDTIIVRAKSRKGRLIFTDAHIYGQAVVVIVDTGSQVTIGNLALQRSLIRRRIWNVPDPVRIESVTGESMTAKVAKLDRLEIAGLNVDQLAVAFADAHIFKQLDLKDRPAILLGMNAMRAFDRISIDFTNRKVLFVLPGTSMRDTIRLAIAN